MTKLLQACPTLCDPVGCSPSGPSVHRILQTRILEWVAIPFSRVFSSPRDQTCVSSTAGRFFTPEPQGSPWSRRVYSPKVWLNIGKPNVIFHHINGLIFYYLYGWRKCILLNSTWTLINSLSKLAISILIRNVIHNDEIHKTILL